MNLEEIKEYGNDFYSKVISRAIENEDFKTRLISKPRNVIEEVYGRKLQLDGSTSIFVEDQTNPNKIFLNIPKKPDYSDLQLSDEQLEVVAGGEIIMCAIGIAIGIECAILAHQFAHM